MTDRKTAALVLAVLLSSCRTAPAPPEVREAELQEQSLRGAGASLFAGPDYAAYLGSLQEARRSLAAESLKLGWFRDYRRIRTELRAVLDEGARILAAVEEEKERRASGLRETASGLKDALRTLDELTLSLAERGKARKALAEASILLSEGESLIAKAEFEAAKERLDAAARRAEEAETSVMSFISRYLDPKLVESWKKDAEETLALSRREKRLVIIVSKLERRLTVYREGQVVKSYEIGLGFNGLSDKRFAGDNATPEGRYKVVRKIPNSQFHKALLLDYPNEEDRRRFARDKAAGRIPSTSTIGGQIEIHGGGEDSLTRGCVSMANDKMDELYDLVGVGTPVTIIGTMELENFVVRAIRKK